MQLPVAGYETSVCSVTGPYEEWQTLELTATKEGQLKKKDKWNKNNGYLGKRKEKWQRHKGPSNGDGNI